MYAVAARRASSDFGSDTPTRPSILYTAPFTAAVAALCP